MKCFNLDGDDDGDDNREKEERKWGRCEVGAGLVITEVTKILILNCFMFYTFRSVMVILC